VLLAISSPRGFLAKASRAEPRVFEVVPLWSSAFHHAEPGAVAHRYRIVSFAI
jgi:hypothetical protein